MEVSSSIVTEFFVQCNTACNMQEIYSQEQSIKIFFLIIVIKTFNLLLQYILYNRSKLYWDKRKMMPELGHFENINFGVRDFVKNY